MASRFASRFRRFVIWGSLGLALLVAAGYGLWRRTPPEPELDLVALFQANNHGIGHMERFQYEEAVTAFEEVVRMQPGRMLWKINLGIALLNTATEANLARAIGLFEQSLQDLPDNPYAHFCLGVIFDYQNKPAQAVPHFEAVTRIDPADAAAWYWLGKNLIDDPEQAADCYRRALQLNPYLHAAIYGLAMKLPDPEQRKALLAKHQELAAAQWQDPTGGRPRYAEMGRYAEVIGGLEIASGMLPFPPGPIPLFAPDGKLQIQLAPGTRWATTEDLRKSSGGELHAGIRRRFGGVMVVLDFDRDGRPDLLLLGAVVETVQLFIGQAVLGGQVHDLLLRNEGEGRFRDVTAEAGLRDSHPSLGCCVADFDNDGYPDLFLTGIGKQRLLRNTGKGGFQDVTAEAGLDQLTTVCLGSAFVDLDQDGDLDLIVAQYAASPGDARVLLIDSSSKLVARSSKPGLAVYLNVGEAPPAKPADDPPPLKPRFRRATEPTELLGEDVPTVGLAVADLDLDRDLDLLILADGTAPATVLNDRLLRFHRSTVRTRSASEGGEQAKQPMQASRWNGGLVLDANHDGRSDLFLIGPGQRPAFLLNQASKGTKDASPWFQPGITNSPPLLQAQAIDLDLDGWTDIVGLSDQHQPVFLHNDSRRLVHAAEALNTGGGRDLAAVAVADFDGDGLPDLMTWSESAGLRLHVNQGNGNHGLQLELTGHRRVEPTGSIVRSNADGFGVWAVAHSGDLLTGAEYTTLSAGLGQSRQPLLLGLGRYPQADVLRLRWPDNCRQAEFSLPAGQLTRIHETNRKGESCPVLFTWNGRRFEFVTDFLGAGTVGESLPQGGTRPPRPEESVKIEAGQLVPQNESYVLKVAEPMDEVTYLDRLQLIVLDHPADVRVYPDERFTTSGPPASQDLLAFRQAIFPVQARDHRGRDMTATLKNWDRDTADGFHRRTWLGLAEEHWVELDFGDRLAKLGVREPLTLFLAGWTDYPYPESIWAATQAGVAMQVPTLERLGPDGRWQPVVAEAGFPAGLPRMMTLDVTGKLGGPRCVLRLRTNMAVYWDQIFIAPLVERHAPPRKLEDSPAGLRFTTPFRVTGLEVHTASLSIRGCMQEYSPDGRQPTLYDYDRLASVPVSHLSGRLTRFGDVTELLHEVDDRFAIFGPGDEVTVRFDAGRLPELPTGWTRSFVLRTWGYCKDCAPFTATGDTIEPLPFRAMRTYPYGPDEHYPRDPLHEDYRRRFNTRQVGEVSGGR